MIFCAYPSQPAAIGQVFESAKRILLSTNREIALWPDNDIIGSPLIKPILSNIDASQFVVADITQLNFNVVFEIGYAIAKNKRVLLVVNAGMSGAGNTLSTVGIFDTLGFKKYENSQQLADIVRDAVPTPQFVYSGKRDKKTPLYLIELPIKNDDQLTIESRIKRARIPYKSFSLSEHVRLSAQTAFEYTSAAYGVIVPLAAQQLPHSSDHNIRAAFVAGLATGFGRTLLICQPDDGPAPADVRDVVVTYRDDRHIKSILSDFALDLIHAKDNDEPSVEIQTTPLAELRIGDPMAENEMRTLSSYYIPTDQFERVRNAEANVVVGRKGMGKTALFIRLRDTKRRDKANIVVDLKPEGYQLKKLKEEVFPALSDANVEHLMVAVWEYLLYIEILSKITEKDKDKYRNDHNINELYKNSRALLDKVRYAEAGDFSDRMRVLVDEIWQILKSEVANRPNQKINAGIIINKIHSNSLKELKSIVHNYLSFKKSTWVLFDNIDKSWSINGIDDADTLILRSLIDAAKKIKRDLDRSSIEAHTVVFVRNDVYDILVRKSSDFGKEITAQLDWSERELMKELVRLRISNGDKGDFDFFWRKYVTPLVDGEDSFSYILERSLYRPRNVVKIIHYARGKATSSRKSLIDEDSILRAIDDYSHDIVEEANNEIGDIISTEDSIMYAFIGEKAKISRSELELIIRNYNTNIDVKRVIDFLLYYGFLGSQERGEAHYIYDFRYKLALMKARIEKQCADPVYILNPAFWPALDIKWH